MAFNTSLDCGRMASSRSGWYATGVSSAATRRIGASRLSKSSSAIRAASSAPNPHVNWSSCAITTRLVFRTAAAMVVQSNGAAGRDADHHGTGERVVRAVPQHRHLIPQLHHRGPDVVEELDLDHRFDPARRHADGAADDVGFGERRVEDAGAAEGPLQAVRYL